ncbi:unnamed protein product [Ostreobium quekettii]|uniref:leucine--tRNA ligase n=1 Tax=Ostreobium quekettii TaxID=121088 RepID=A0A8S1JB22_9CHLO|nr:unnamed protein product [Ostreobium quekettii]|eukprot:evm.model.scf_812.5 EVM.evm.TU.scf_812.5   scf_812:33917-44169(+)
MASGTEASPQQSTERRDTLLEIQKARQTEWARADVFRADAPTPGQEAHKDEKFFGNFPYPYMNGLLHLGHAFSLSKLEFKAAFERLRGRNVLFPQAFHCTGMPIKACADKLDKEIREYGCPPAFPEPESGETVKKEAQAAGTKTDPAKFGGKKSKAVAKTGGVTHQWTILEKSGFPEDEIPKFRDPLHWLQLFPGKGVEHLKLMGCGIDWRRSFITTDANPYYDSFIQWQFRKLKKMGRIVKDKRHTIFSVLDGQPCLDHDRAAGEGVLPQEYTLIKMEAVELTAALEPLSGQGRVFFMAATLRPETMYGQTNFWILPKGEYGAYKGLKNEIYIMSERSALNLAYQEKTPIHGQPECLLKIKGQDLIGTAVKSPNCQHDRIYALPLMTIKMDKGTGVVTSVPSDAPDDYIALRDLKEKPELREKHGVKDEWVLPFNIIPIIEIEGFGNMAAVTVSNELKIKSQHDTAKLQEAKERTYLKGFTSGIMIVGEYNGRKVSEAKPLLKKEMVERGEAMLYSEPESLVMSRSGDKCIVALTDQWYITYGEEEWANLTKECLQQLNCYAPEAKNNFTHVLGWLERWAISRSYGLGTKIPWDPEYLVESLSDSTIYMAYYTVAHLLQKGNLYGSDHSGISPDHLTDEIWDYILLGADMPADSQIPEDTLKQLRNEFEYWYPFDLRVSGKDLIQNHLTFCLYNHTALFPKEQWPKAFRCNGHVMVDAEKMSKSRGNFLTLEQAISKFSSDAMRVGLADAGDGLDDANFEGKTANAAILRLTKELTWIEQIMASQDSLRPGPPTSFLDRVFDNEINIAIRKAFDAYDKLLFREALKSGWYDLQSARDRYRFSCKTVSMNRELIMRYVEISTLLMVPIAPHTMDHTWVNVLKKGESVLTAGWPQAPEPDYGLQQAATYLEDFITSQRRTKQKLEAPGKVRKGQAPPPKQKLTKMEVSVAEEFIGWQKLVLASLSSQYDPLSNAFPPKALDHVIEAMSGAPEVSGMSQKDLKAQVMPFAKHKMEQARSGAGVGALGARLTFDERALLVEMTEYVKDALAVQEMTVALACQAGQAPDGKIEVYPGSPLVVFQ